MSAYGVCRTRSPAWSERPIGTMVTFRIRFSHIALRRLGYLFSACHADIALAFAGEMVPYILRVKCGG